MVAGPVRWWKKLDFVATDNHYHFRGSFPAIRAVTGRRPRAFSLFMKIFREKADPFFFFLTD
ncbi:hypothetical protein FIA73_24685 [Escherichia coli]|nr:hypothetical protein [Escherichia coli]EGO6581674.1 hypothetical protein [Escherichia coli]MBW9708173.1 hypothetical protein [Escherichia coli]